MSIQSPVGTLDIKNATLRVGKLEVSNIQGVDTALNVTRANSVLIYDDQVSTTTFNGFTSSVGVRDTGNGYLDLAGGYVYWGQKLPNSWVMDFEMDIRSGTNAGPLYANVFSTTNTGGDGYSFTFNDSNDKISLYYDSTLLTETTVSGLFTASEDWQKVVINYERGLIAISLDGSRKFYYKDIERETPYVNGEYVSFSSASTDGRKIRDLRIVNGEKWVYSGESNVVYTQGSVGIGVTDPTVALDVSGTVKATAFDGDGSAITNISSANVGDFASNVVRIENLETSNGHIWSNLASNVTILRDEIDSNLATARTDLQSNVTILRGEIDSNLATARTDLQSNVTILRGEIDSNLATARTDLQSNVTILRGEIDSNLATARTDLQSNVTILRGEIDSNLATARTDLQSNVTILRGEIDSNLATARTDLQSNVTILRDTAITFMGTKTFQDDVVLESNLRVQGDLLVANTVNMTVSDPILELGSNNLNTGDVGIVMTRHGASNSNVAVFFDETADTLKLGYTLNGANDTTLEFDSNALAVSVQGALTASTGTFSGDFEVGTANMFVDTTAGNVGIGTTSPATLCDLSLASGTDYSNTVALTIRNYSSDYTQIANGFGSRIHFRTNRGTTGGSTSPSADIKGYVYSGAGGTGDYHALDLDVYGDNSSLNRGISIVSTSASGGPANTIMYGDVGIGTTSPDDNLHIYSSETGGTQLKIQNANTSGDTRAGLFLQTRNSNNFSLQFTPSSDTVIFDNKGQGGYSFYQKNGSGTINNVMQILPDGNVGIGATSPSAKLHVNGGNLKISAAAGGGVYDNGYQWLECDNDGTWGRLARTARTNGIACYNGIAINDNGGLVVGSWDSPNALGVGNGKFTGNLYVNGSYHESGVKVRTTREWYFDLTAQANTNFYPILLKHSGYMIPINFKLVGESLAGGNSYNEETLVGFVRGGGWTDHNPFYEVTSNRYESTEKRIQGIWEGSAATNDHVAIYVRGGYNYRIDTDADTAFVSTTAYSFGSTTNDAVFAIKNESGTDVSGTSRAISELVDTAASNHASRKFVKSAVYISDSLECQGRIYANNGCHAIGDWFRVNGSNGIYFESHGGGWHMTDGSWVRAYGGKGVYAAGAFYTDANRSVIRGESPTLYFRDTNAASAMIHNNDNILYILRGGTDTEGWSQVNGVWPWMFNLGNNDSTCGGSLYCYGNVTAYSDIRHKRDIVKLDNALEKVEKLNGYKYTRKNDGKRYTGLIAQEVLEVLPEAVIADEKGEYSLAYGNMAGLFVEAMKEMSDQLQAEKAKVATLETQLASVLARLDALENPPS